MWDKLEITWPTLNKLSKKKKFLFHIRERIEKFNCIYWWYQLLFTTTRTNIIIIWDVGNNSECMEYFPTLRFCHCYIKHASQHPWFLIVDKHFSTDMSCSCSSLEVSSVTQSSRSLSLIWVSDCLASEVVHDYYGEYYSGKCTKAQIIDWLKIIISWNLF